MQEASDSRPTLFEETLAAHLAARDGGLAAGAGTLIDLWPDMAAELEDFLGLEAELVRGLGRDEVERARRATRRARRDGGRAAAGAGSGSKGARAAAASAERGRRSAEASESARAEERLGARLRRWLGLGASADADSSAKGSEAADVGRARGAVESGEAEGVAARPADSDEGDAVGGPPGEASAPSEASNGRASDASKRSNARPRATTAGGRTHTNEAHRAPEPGPGSMLGGCRLERELPRGRYGRRFRATQLFLRREVCLELLDREAAGDASLRARLATELRLRARLDHPAFPAVHAVEGGEGRLWILGAPCWGRSLEVEREGAPPTARECLTAARAACVALAHARERGLVVEGLAARDLVLDDSGRLRIVGGRLRPLTREERDRPWQRADLGALARSLWPSIARLGETL